MSDVGGSYDSEQIKEYTGFARGILTRWKRFIVPTYDKPLLAFRQLWMIARMAS